LRGWVQRLGFGLVAVIILGFGGLIISVVISDATDLHASRKVETLYAISKFGMVALGTAALVLGIYLAVRHGVNNFYSTLHQHSGGSDTAQGKESTRK
jgi:hypothetical protein